MLLEHSFHLSMPAPFACRESKTKKRISVLLGPTAGCLDPLGCLFQFSNPWGYFFGGCATCQIPINCLKSKVTQPAQNMKYRPWGFPTSPLSLDRETATFQGNFSIKHQRFGSESAGVALRRRKIQLPREGTNQRFSSLEKFPLLHSKSFFASFPSGCL